MVGMVVVREVEVLLMVDHRSHPEGMVRRLHCLRRQEDTVHHLREDGIRRVFLAYSNINVTGACL